MLAAELQFQIDAAMAELGDISEGFTYHRMKSATYNPTTGTATTVKVSVRGSGIVAGYSTTEIDGLRVLSTDRRIVFSKNQLEFVPESDDYLVIDGEQRQWNVIDVQRSPVHWMLQLRPGAVS